MKPVIRAPFILLGAALAMFAADGYQKPPKVVMDILNAPSTPTLVLNPTNTYAVQGSPIRYPPVAELAMPMRRLAGIRINPLTNGLHNATFNSTLILRKLPEGTEIKMVLPPNPKLSPARWSPDGKHFVFTNSTEKGVDIWVGDAATGRTHRIEGIKVNDVFGTTGAPGRGGAPAGGTVQWLGDSRTLVVHAIKANRGPEPTEPLVPPGPDVQESLGGAKGVETYEDMLKSPHDEEDFEYLATSQVMLVDTVTGKGTPLGKPGIVRSVRPSPDGKFFLVTSVHRPFSYLHPATQFPSDIEVWDRTGKTVHHVASLPLGGVGRGGFDPTGDDNQLPPPPSGTRNLQWRTSQPATLLWVENIGPLPPRTARGRGARAARGADATPPPPRPERMLTLAAPFTGTPQEIYTSADALPAFTFFDNGHWMLLGGGGRGGRGGGGAGANRIQKTLLVDLDKPSENKELWSTDSHDRYADHGTPLQRTLPNGERAILLDGDSMYLTGNGPSPTGDHPFLKRFNLATLQSEDLFKCDDDHYEAVEALLDPHAHTFFTRRESPTEPPNYYLRTSSGKLTAFTNFPDPQPIMRKVAKKFVAYKRPDGVDMSFTLYLPPDYKEGTRLPTVIWAYPYEYEDADAAAAAAGTGSRERFTEIGGYSEIFFALDGFAVLDNASMPIVGPRASVNDHFVDQVVMDAKAAIDKAVELGVTDPTRVGVGGHSYGAFMTDTLLAHSELFKAGIAESGAPNRTLTPFGFQNERRTLWDDPKLYEDISPFMFADKIKSPLLLIHGEADDNNGTFPIQSERMYEAVRGNGGTVRLVFLPFEAHGYRGKESIEQVDWEKLTWFNKYVKDGARVAPSTVENQHR
ncbi:MAG TPA: prolyl oligopeptidase family serine peptidase [Bryobacteraceae bacterium]|jgi:dipeptidyl aminopeptidase/acylaminoacyl peptidase|nr:prolyl oligopeptidase family serine peptidase [Bryobacteraceae bacterium]